MRVLLVSHVAPPHIGGVENVVLMEARAFCAAGHEVVWVTSDGGGDGAEPAAEPGLRIRRVRAWHLLERLFGIAYPLFSPTLPFVLWREVGRADLVHVHGLVFPGSPLAALFARLRGRRCLCTDHGGMLRYPSRIATFSLRVLMATAGRLTARCCHRLIAYNHDIEALLVRLAGTGAKVRYLPNPADVALFQPPTPAQKHAAREALGWTDGRPRVLCISRLLPHKGVDVLLDAQCDEFAVVFCGPGEDAMRAHIRGRGATCLEPRPREQLLQLYHAADVFALPSHNEGFPIAIQEALACGLPVVTSDMEAYASYRDTPGLHLCEPTATAVREHVLAALRRPGAATEGPPAADTEAWIRQLVGDLPARRAPRGFVASLVLALLALHFAFGVVRWPAGTIHKRAESIAEHERLGQVGWHYRHCDDETRRIATWLAATVPEGEVVLFDGNRQGSLQLLAPLLFPRLLVEAGARRGALDASGRPVFAARAPWIPADTTGVPVVIGSRERLRLEYR